ncbi:MAG: folate-binding protein YgfZ [Burkholderiales bacterium]|nr:folate-binding protein YgfZ [Burkholderiales bacterium]
MQQQDNLINALGVIEITGSDSQKFLQSQLTNDINELDTKPFQLSAHLNHKGRILANFIITKRAAQTYYLITPKEIIELIIPRLTMFILRSKVNIIHSKQELCFSKNHLPDTPTLEIFPEYYLMFDQQNTEHETSQLWKKAAIEHGLPMIYKATQEVFIPQHVNLDLINGINFKKGCYPGQEIVARTHYLGKVKRRMFSFTTNYMPLIGQKVVSPKLDNQEVGIIVDYLKYAEGYHGLVSIQLNCIDSAFLDKDNQQPLIIKPLLTHDGLLIE